MYRSVAIDDRLVMVARSLPNDKVVFVVEMMGFRISLYARNRAIRLKLSRSNVVCPRKPSTPCFTVILERPSP